MTRQRTINPATPEGRNPSVAVRATAQLRRRDKTLRRIIDRAGPCTLTPRRRYFIALCEAIVSQQLAAKAAATIFQRFCGLFDRHTPTPASVLGLSDTELRSAGLSSQKLGYVRDLARKLSDGTIPQRRLSRMEDEAVIEALTRVKGIGMWTAQMFLIFVLNRPDVWPTDDLGVRRAVQIQFGLKDLPNTAQLTELAEPWRPYRSIAAWYLWQSLDNKPMDA